MIKTSTFASPFFLLSKWRIPFPFSWSFFWSLPPSPNRQSKEWRNHFVFQYFNPETFSFFFQWLWPNPFGCATHANMGNGHDDPIFGPRNGTTSAELQAGSLAILATAENATRGHALFVQDSHWSRGLRLCRSVRSGTSSAESISNGVEQFGLCSVRVPFEAGLVALRNDDNFKCKFITDSRLFCFPFQ